MFHAWFTSNVGIVTFALAAVTIVAAATAVRFVTRRYATRSSVAVALGVLAASLVLPWLSHGSATKADTPVRPLPTVSVTRFARQLDEGKVRAVAAISGDAELPGATVFETASGRWDQAEVPPSALGTKQQARVAHLESVRVPAAIRARVEGPRNDYLVGFLVLEILSMVAGSMAVLSASGLPRRVDLDKALARLVAEHHGHETV